MSKSVMDCHLRILHAGQSFPSPDVIFIGDTETKEGPKDCIMNVGYFCDKTTLHLETKNNRKFKMVSLNFSYELGNVEILHLNKRLSNNDLVSRALKQSKRGTDPDIIKIDGICAIVATDDTWFRTQELDLCLNTYAQKFVYAEIALKKDGLDKLEILRKKGKEYKARLDGGHYTDFRQEVMGRERVIGRIAEKIIKGEKIYE